MFIAKLTKEEKHAYGSYKKLREYAPKANISTLSQISVYIARANFDDEVYANLRFKYNEDRNTSVLLLDNGMEIEFYDETNDFDFLITRDDKKYSMNTLVSLSDPNNLSSVNIYSELKIEGYGMYVVTFRPKNLSDENSLKYGTINYYTWDEVDWVKEFAEEDVDNNFDVVAKNNGIYPFAEKSEFDLSMQTDMVLDVYQGYISNVLSRIDLLYDNMKYMRIKRRKKHRN